MTVIIIIDGDGDAIIFIFFVILNNSPSPSPPCPCHPTSSLPQVDFERKKEGDIGNDCLMPYKGGGAVPGNSFANCQSQVCGEVCPLT